jgi:outer membrane protein OmpA-like peptidoglycan-associated protein
MYRSEKQTTMKIIILTLLLSAGLFAQTLSTVPGAYADIGFGVRPMGMGGAFTAVADDPNAAYWNPAALLAVPFPGASMMFTRQMGLVPYYYLAAKQDINSYHGLGVALQYNGDALYNEFDSNLSYSYKLGRHFHRRYDDIYLGANLHYRHIGFGDNPDGGIGQIRGDATGFGLDLSGYWKINGRYAVAVVWRDFLDVLNWNSHADDVNYSNQYNEDIPASLTFGAMARLSPTTLVALDYRRSLHRETYDRIAFGIEKGLLGFLQLRAGTSQNLFSSSDEINRHYDLGLGINPEFANSDIGVAVNFAYQFSDINPTLRFGLDLNWGMHEIIPPPPIGAFVAEPDTIRGGETSVLRWLVKRTSSITIEPGIGLVDTTGEIEVRPTNNTVYRLIAKGPGGTMTYEVPVVVMRNIPPPVISAGFFPDTIRAGEETDLRWNVENGLTLTLAGHGQLPLSGNIRLAPSESGEYIFTSTGAGGKSTVRARITVGEAAARIEEPARQFVLQGLTFGSGSATLSADSYAVLDEVIKTLVAYPAVRIQVRGYTDNSGRRNGNIMLSQKRAEAVMYYLIGRGISASRLEAVGFGPDNPIADNKSAAGRAENRRIEFVRVD